MFKFITVSTLMLALAGCILVPVGHRHYDGEQSSPQRLPEERNEGDRHESEHRDDDRRCDHRDGHDCGRERHD